MRYDGVSDDMLAQALAVGFPTLAGRMTAGEVRWLWERYDPERVDAAMWRLECGGCAGDPFDEVRRLIKPDRLRTIHSMIR